MKYSTLTIVLSITNISFSMQTPRLKPQPSFQKNNNDDIPAEDYSGSHYFIGNVTVGCFACLDISHAISATIPSKK